LKKTSPQPIQDIDELEGVKTVLVEGNVEVQYPSYVYFIQEKKGLKISIKRILTASLRTVYPSFLVKKFGAVLNKSQMKQILEKWDSFIETGE
jgi:hypothetical protein